MILNRLPQYCHGLVIAAQPPEALVQRAHQRMIGRVQGDRLLTLAMASSTRPWRRSIRASERYITGSLGRIAASRTYCSRALP